jgi:hypothetical protein
MGRAIANVMAVIFMIGSIVLFVVGALNNSKEALLVAAVLFVGGTNLFFTAKDPD